MIVKTYNKFRIENLVEFELFFPVVGLVPVGLLFFVEKIVSHDEIIHFGAHEAAVSVVGRADYRFSADVERSVYNDPVARFFLESIDELPVFGICLAAYALYSCRKIDVGDRGNVAAQEVKPFVKRQFFIFVGKFRPSRFKNRRD